MDEPLAQTLVIRPARSLYLVLFIICAHFGALAAIGWSGLLPQIKVSAMTLVLIAFARTFQCWRTGFNHAWENVFMLTAEGAWLRRDMNGGLVPLTVLPPVFVHPKLIVVRLRSISGSATRHHLVLLPDSLDLDTTRRLRVRLRFPP